MSRIKEIKENEKIFNYKKYYGVTWEVTSNCNLKCRYCVLNSEEYFQDTSKIISFINRLNKRNNVSTTLFGGEPTQHPDILRIVESLESHIQLFSNMSGPIELYEEILRLKPDTRIETTYHNDQKNFTEFFKKVEVLSKRTRVLVYLMLDTKYSDIREMYEILRTINVDISVLKIQNKDQRELSPEEESWFKSVHKGDQVIIVDDSGKETPTSVGYIYANNLNNFKYYLCDCGKKNMYISSKGLCYPCLDYKRGNLPFYDINSPNDSSLEEILSKGTVCLMPYCTSEISTPKKRTLNLKKR